jgi:hypothetical protein
MNVRMNSACTSVAGIGRAASIETTVSAASGKSSASCSAIVALEEWPTMCARWMPRWSISSRQWRAWSAIVSEPSTRSLPPKPARS